MCNAGRIIHHLRHNLSKPETQLIFVGYQARGSLGRRIIEGINPVKIFGEEVEVKANIHTLNGFSAHAGQTDLLSWFDAIAQSMPRVVLTHGEDGPRSELAKQIRERYELECELPEMGEVIEL